MTTPNRFAVPLDVLDGVQVRVSEQVQEESCGVPHPDASLWAGALPPAHGGGGGSGCSADGD